MENIKSLQTEALVEMLAKDTADYLKMRTEGASSLEFTACKKHITQLQDEILSRKKKPAKNQPAKTTKQPAKSSS